jgi:hypothetical protein
MKELLNNGKEITLQAFSFESPGAEVNSHKKVQKSLQKVSGCGSGSEFT